MSTEQRFLGGLWCRDVMERLPDYVDGTLDEAELRAVQDHVAGCRWCERFGGRYGALVGALRTPEAPAVPEGMAERLEQRLARLLG
jgi:anti-sigma factor RsiW